MTYDKCKEEKAYYELMARIDKLGLELTNESTDHENVPFDIEDDSPEYWIFMKASGSHGAAFRAEELGLNLNELLGEIIY
jgi:hypothetical protein